MHILQQNILSQTSQWTHIVTYHWKDEKISKMQTIIIHSYRLSSWILHKILY